MSETYLRDRTIQRPALPGRIYLWQLKAASLCAQGQVDFYKRHGLSQKEILDFVKNGMPIEEFKSRFGHDVMAQQGIAYWGQHYGR